MSQPIEPWNPDRWDHPDETFFLIDEHGWAVPFEHGTERTPALVARRVARGRRTSAPRWAAALSAGMLFAVAPSAVAYGQETGGAVAPPAEETVTGNVNIGVYGDSYTAGEGADDNQGLDEYIDPQDQRHQSTHAPAAVAGSLLEGANPGLEVTMPFAASSGAVTGDVNSPQQRSVGGAGNSNMPQMGQVPSDLDGIVVGLGGNDAKFADVMFDGAVMPRDEEGMTAAIERILADDPPVTIESISPEEMQAQIDEARATDTQPLNLAARLAMTYQDIRAQHPDAAMVVVNYPVAVDPNVEIDAPMGFGFNTEELTAIQQFANEVNAQIATAVENCGCGAALADVSDAFEGNEAGTADPDIVGLMREDEDAGTHRQRERLHPNMSGAEKIGRAIADVMARELGIESPAADAAVDMEENGVDQRVAPAPAQPSLSGGRNRVVPPRSEWPGATATEIENIPPSHPDLPAESLPGPSVAPQPPTAPQSPGITPRDELPVVPIGATPDDSPSTPVLVVPGKPSDGDQPADGTPPVEEGPIETPGVQDPPATPQNPATEGPGDADSSEDGDPASEDGRPVEDVVRPDEEDAEAEESDDAGDDPDESSSDTPVQEDSGAGDRPVEDIVRPDDDESDDEPGDDDSNDEGDERDSAPPRNSGGAGSESDPVPYPSTPPSVSSDPPEQPTPPTQEDTPQVPDTPDTAPDRSDPPAQPTPPTPDSPPSVEDNSPSRPDVDSSSPPSPTAPDVDDDVPEPPSPGNSNDDWDGPSDPPSQPTAPEPDNSPSVDDESPSRPDPPSDNDVAVSVSDTGSDRDSDSGSDSGWGSAGGSSGGGGSDSGPDSSDGPGPGEGSMDAAAGSSQGSGGSSSSGGSSGGPPGTGSPGPGEGSMDAAAGSSQGAGAGTSGDGIGLIS